MKTADLVDRYDDRTEFCNLTLPNFGGATAFHGPVVTVKCHEDNVLLRSCLSEPGEGRVLVVDGGGSTRCAVVGDLIASLAQRNGWVGLVINGCVRDVATLRDIPIGIRALGSSPKKSGKRGFGERDVPVRFGGVWFRTGNWLYSDEDGVLLAADRLDLD